MMRFANVRCSNPNCGARYDAAVEDGYHAPCPGCGQANRVPGKDMTPEITGLCDRCQQPLDEHIFGRLTFCCPPKKGRSF